MTQWGSIRLVSNIYTGLLVIIYLIRLVSNIYTGLLVITHLIGLVSIVYSVNIEYPNP
jgi:F0F1-type ATP synthase membrane subunit a